jgi:hypothetical protein
MRHANVWLRKSVKVAFLPICSTGLADAGKWDGCPLDIVWGRINQRVIVRVNDLVLTLRSAGATIMVAFVDFG